MFSRADHLFARQQKGRCRLSGDPDPADAGYHTFNRDAYLSGDILPNSGYLRVTVSPASAKVEYVRAWLPRDKQADRKNGEVAFSHNVTSRAH